MPKLNDIDPADLFAVFRSSRPGESAQRVQLSRLNEIIAARAIPIAYKSVGDFEAALAGLSGAQQAFVLERLAAGLPAVVQRVGPAGRLDQVWFPVEIDTELPGQVLANEAAAGEASGRVNFVPETQQNGALLEGREVGSDVLGAWTGAAYGAQWADD